MHVYVYTLTGAGSSPLPSGEGSKIALGLGARYITKRHEGGREVGKEKEEERLLAPAE